MGESLQEQLLKAGLVDRQKLSQAKAAKRKQTKQRHKGNQGPADRERIEAERAWAEKAKLDRELNRQRQEQLKRKAATAEIRQLIRTHRVGREGGEIAYHFVDGKKLKKIWVTPPLQAQLGNGTLAVAKLGDAYELVPAVIAEKIRARDATRILLSHSADEPRDPGEDPYAEYQVPDDLIW